MQKLVVLINVSEAFTLGTNTAKVIYAASLFKLKPCENKYMNQNAGIILKKKSKRRMPFLKCVILLSE